MGIVMSDENKLANGYGTGEGKDYKPFVLTKDVRKIGTRSNLRDWKHGRMLHLLSQGELWLYALLRWREDVEDIREQYPLEKKRVTEIAGRLKMHIPRNILTTDLLVTKTGGVLVAYSVKQDRSVMNDDNTVRRQLLEKRYWEEEEAEFHLIFKEDLPEMACRNILTCIRFYGIDTVGDEIGMVKHLIANHALDVDIHKRIDFKELADRCIDREGFGLWMRSRSDSGQSSSLGKNGYVSLVLRGTR